MESFNPQAVEGEHAPSGAAAADGRWRILVVDDHADCAESTALVLRLEGHTVITAADGPSALRVAAVFRPTAVVLDLGLPGMDGYEIARRLRGRLPASGRLIALTGYAGDDYRRRARAAGFDEFLVKPCDPRDLLRAVRPRRLPVPAEGGPVARRAVRWTGLSLCHAG